jgi:hypothetical protein
MDSGRRRDKTLAYEMNTKLIGKREARKGIRAHVINPEPQTLSPES